MAKELQLVQIDREIKKILKKLNTKEFYTCLKRLVEIENECEEQDGRVIYE